MEEEAKHPYPCGTIVTTTNNDRLTIVGRIIGVHEAHNLEYRNDEGGPSLEYRDPIYYTIEYWDEVIVTADALGPESMAIPNTPPNGVFLTGFRNVKRSDIRPPQWIGEGGGGSGEGDERAPVRGSSTEHGTRSPWLSRPGEEELDQTMKGVEMQKTPRFEHEREEGQEFLGYAVGCDVYLEGHLSTPANPGFVARWGDSPPNIQRSSLEEIRELVLQEPEYIFSGGLQLGEEAIIGVMALQGFRHCFPSMVWAMPGEGKE